MSAGYIIHEAKRIQPKDGLKRAETCSCVIVQYSTINFVMFRLLVIYFVFRFLYSWKIIFKMELLVGALNSGSYESSLFL